MAAGYIVGSPLLLLELSNQLDEMSERRSSTLKLVIFPKLIFKSVVLELKAVSHRNNVMNVINGG